MVPKLGNAGAAVNGPGPENAGPGPVRAAAMAIATDTMRPFRRIFT